MDDGYSARLGTHERDRNAGIVEAITRQPKAADWCQTVSFGEAKARASRRVLDTRKGDRNAGIVEAIT